MKKHFSTAAANLETILPALAFFQNLIQSATAQILPIYRCS